MPPLSSTSSPRSCAEPVVVSALDCPRLGAGDRGRPPVLGRLALPPGQLPHPGLTSSRLLSAQRPSLSLGEMVDEETPGGCRSPRMRSRLCWAGAWSAAQADSSYCALSAFWSSSCCWCLSEWVSGRLCRLIVVPCRCEHPRPFPSLTKPCPPRRLAAHRGMKHYRVGERNGLPLAVLISAPQWA